MATKNPWLKKLQDIKYNYGELASNHLKAHPVCKVCYERRIACLAVHHVHGKSVDVFETLCCNCHAIRHANYSVYTFDDFNKESLKKGVAEICRAERNRLIFRALDSGMSINDVARLCGVCGRTVYKLLMKRRSESKDEQ